MTRWSEKLRQPTVLLGDFNIAPLECDVWNHKALLDVVSHTPVEVDLLTALRQSHDWIDLGRQFVPAPEQLFTWWSYRARDWQASDRASAGSRLGQPAHRERSQVAPSPPRVAKLAEAIGPHPPHHRLR